MGQFFMPSRQLLKIAKCFDLILDTFTNVNDIS